MPGRGPLARTSWQGLAGRHDVIAAIQTRSQWRFISLWHTLSGDPTVVVAVELVTELAEHPIIGQAHCLLKAFNGSGAAVCRGHHILVADLQAAHRVGDPAQHTVMDEQGQGMARMQHKAAL